LLTTSRDGFENADDNASIAIDALGRPAESVALTFRRARLRRALLIVMLLAASAHAQDAASPVTVPVLPFHLTARPWQPSYVGVDAYLDIAESVARVQATFQDAAGAIVDPYSRAEKQYQTPYFAAAVAMLVASNRALDLLPKGVLAMDRATWEIASGRASIPDDHGEFFVHALAQALPLYAPRVPPAQLHVWTTRMQTPLSLIVQGKDHNWRTYAMKGEWLRAAQGLVDKAAARNYIERYWTGEQRASFTASRWNLYHDKTGTPDSFVYEAVARGNLFAMLRAGYDGPSAADMNAILRRGTRAALLLQDPSGQNPAAGRSGGHTWSDTLAGTSFEQLAETTWKEGADPGLAGQLRRAAVLALTSVRRWRRPDGSYSVTKNAFDPALHVGYANYSWFANYNGNVMLHSAESARVRRNHIPERPAPAEIGGFALVTDPKLANAFANAGGMLVQAGLRGSTTLRNGRYWTTLGIVRFGRVGWDSQLGPSEGVRNRISGLGVSYAPTFLEAGKWVRLASVPERYEAQSTIHFTHPLLVRISIDYIPKVGQIGPTFRDELIITPDGVLSTVSGSTPDFGVTWPLLENNGSPLRTSISTRIATTALVAGSDEQSFIALQPTSSIAASDAPVRSAYGDLRPLRLTTRPSSTVETFIYPRNPLDPSAETVRTSFVRDGNDFVSVLGRVQGTLYVGRTSAGGVGRSIDLDGNGTPDVTFSAICAFVLQLRQGKVLAIESDAAVTAQVQGRTVSLSPSTPISFAAPLRLNGVTASSAQSGNGIVNVLDGNLGSRWSAQGDGQWAQLDLGSVRAVNEVRIAWYSGSTRTTRFEVQTSRDGTSWTSTIPRTSSSGKTTALESYPVAVVPARYVRVIGHGNSVNDWISITELRATGY
jgi:hypothetical protein